MILYLSIILFAMLAIATAVALIAGESFFAVLGFTAFAVVIVICLDGLTATVCRLLPAKCANAEKKFFIVSAGEKKFYEKLNIRKWKDKIPEIGQFTGFRKNKIADPKSVEYLDRFLLEICYGEIGHITSVFTSFFLLAFFFITPLWWAIALPVATVSALMNLPSLFILRYNSYKLRILRESNLKKQRREAEKRMKAAAERIKEEKETTEAQTEAAVAQNDDE